MNKKIIMIIISIIVVVSIFLASTYAVFFKQDKLENEESFTTGILDIVVEPIGDNLSLSNSMPMSDEDGRKTTPFQYKITNKGNLSYTFDLTMISTTTENAVNSNYIKVMVNDSEPVLFSELTDNVVVSDITLGPGESIIVSVRLWLDITTPNSEIGKKFDAEITSYGEGDEYVKPEPNAPNINNGLIPVMYSNDTWVKADSVNEDETYKWYDYSDKQWANAVLVSETNRDTYKSAVAGTPIPEDDILAYYVWIPRYKYKVWNITKTMGTDSYSAQTTGIDIVFEEGTASTGTIECTYDFTIAEGNGLLETCSGANGNYYTHPAFTFGDTEVEGIWVGKFEISTPETSACYTSTSNANCRNTTLGVRVKPNANSWRNNYVDYFSTAIQNMDNVNNEYGLATNSESHMLKNIEWGAVVYLTNSNYGRCSGGTCEEIAINSYNGFKTGCGPQDVGVTTSGTTCNIYTNDIGKSASTTGNEYGIYDMSGGSQEYVMGNSSSASGTYTYNQGSGSTSYTYSADTAKYIDTYAYGTTYNDQTAYNRARLGDGTGEVTITTTNTGWYGDIAYFVHSSYPWFQRGGYYGHGAGAGAFSFYKVNGISTYDYSARAALLSF